MNIAYPYNPAQQDLWLYEPITVSYTVPSPVNLTVLRPYAWNPNSPLYGYRNSLRGLTARLRVMLTNAEDPLYYPYNDPADPANRPCYWNSWPMSQRVIGTRFMHSCAHCYGVTLAQQRDENQRLIDAGSGGWYAANTIFDALLSESFRWLDSDDSLIQHLDPTDILAPYMSDPVTMPNFGIYSDFAVMESVTDLLAPPVTYCDPRSLPPDATGYMLDSNHKIVRFVHYRSFVDRELLRTSGGTGTAVNPDGSPSPLQPQIQLHDSGTHYVFPMQEPSSIAAGDGIAGFVTADISSGEWVTKEAAGDIANRTPLEVRNVQQYMALRGSPVPVDFAIFNGPYASQSIEQQILATLEGLPIT